MNNIFLATSKDSFIGLSEGALYSLLSIIMVFVILFIIIGVTELIFKLLGLFDLKKELEENKTSDNKNKEVNSAKEKVVIEDEDMMVACLIASIDYKEEINKDVRVVSVRRL